MYDSEQDDSRARSTRRERPRESSASSHIGAIIKGKKAAMLMPGEIEGEHIHSMPFYFRMLNLAVPAVIIGGVFGGPIGIAIGALVGGSIGLVYSIVTELYQIYTRKTKKGYTRLDTGRADVEEEEVGEFVEKPIPEGSRLKRNIGPSKSRLFTWDVSIFFGSMSLAMVGFLFGGPLGAAIGAIVGIVVAGFMHAAYVKYLEIAAKLEEAEVGNNLETPNPLTEKNPGRELLKTSLHDVPWYFRGFVGLALGAKLQFGHLRDNIVTDGNRVSDARIHDAGGHVEHLGMIGAMIGLAAALLYPYFGKVIEKYITPLQEWVNKKLGLKPQTQADKAWWQESTMDTPIYGRAFAGVVLGSIIGTLLFPGIGTLAGIIIFTTLAVTSPYLFALGNSTLTAGKKIVGALILAAASAALFPFIGFVGIAILASGLFVIPIGVALSHYVAERAQGTFYLAKLISRDADDNKAHNTQGDFPWYLRLLVGAIGGTVLMGALSFFVPGLAVLAVVGGMMLYALAQPLINKVGQVILDKIEFSALKTYRAAVDVHIMSYKRITVGAIVGAIIGSSVGFFLLKAGILLLAVGAPVPIIPLGIMAGMALGILIGAGVCFVWPYIKALGVALFSDKSNEQANEAATRDAHDDLADQANLAVHTPKNRTQTSQQNGADKTKGKRTDSGFDEFNEDAPKDKQGGTTAPPNGKKEDPWADDAVEQFTTTEVDAIQTESVVTSTFPMEEHATTEPALTENLVLADYTQKVSPVEVLATKGSPIFHGTDEVARMDEAARLKSAMPQPEFSADEASAKVSTPSASAA